MIGYESTRGGGPVVRVAFTDVRADLAVTAPGAPGVVRALEEQYAVRVAAMSQVHGHAIANACPGEQPTADALVATEPGVALLVRVADCVPVLLGDAAHGVVGAAHAGRRGVQAGVVPRTVARMRELGATDIAAWIGPHVCGACYEVPAEMREEVAAAVPATYAATATGTPALDLGAGVAAQLREHDVAVTAVDGCTREDPRWHSHRRDAQAAGRFAGLVWWTP